MKTAKTERGMEAFPWAATSPCKIDEVFTKCGTEYLDLTAHYMESIKDLQNQANFLKSEEEKKQFWEKVKTDPENVAEWQMYQEEVQKYFVDDKSTWVTKYVSKDEKEGKWMTFISAR